MNHDSSSVETRDHDWIMAETERLKALGETERREARDPVSQPIINAWLDAMEETDPRFTQGVAPPAMAQVWTMPGLRGTRGADDPLSGAMEMLDAAGYTSVLGTNCDQTYERYLRVGEQVSVTTRLDDVAGPKQTGVGEGYFVTTRNVWRVGDEVVASMLFRVLKFKPRPTPTSVRRRTASKIIRPVRNQDTDFFWEGTAAGRAADPEVQRLRGAAPPARAGVPGVPRDGPRVRRREWSGHDLQLPRAPRAADAGPGAAGDDRARRARGRGAVRGRRTRQPGGPRDRRPCRRRRGTRSTTS